MEETAEASTAPRGELDGVMLDSRCNLFSFGSAFTPTAGRPGCSLL